jgi:hypothetical protein
MKFASKDQVEYDFGVPEQKCAGRTAVACVVLKDEIQEIRKGNITIS